MSVFTSIPEDRIIHRGNHFFLVYDAFPVSDGHILIISKENKVDYFSLNVAERNELTHLIHIAKDIIERDSKPDGYNIGMNCGVASGQTVMHFHCHVIPRYHGDMDNPRGGVRHCITGKGYY